MLQLGVQFTRFQGHRRASFRYSVHLTDVSIGEETVCNCNQEVPPLPEWHNKAINELDAENERLADWLRVANADWSVESGAAWWPLGVTWRKHTQPTSQRARTSAASGTAAA